MGQMAWLDAPGHDRKILHLRETPSQPWRPYTMFPKLKQPDLTTQGASKGWTTHQWLRAAGWSLVPTTEAQSIVAPEAVQP